ncbi:hypothetical protein JOQ06_000249 [Pogonophryne albipinna]|uniref:Uncharacterized protein n=1 Tax=Pogonophryne albipinna TaxID=1090488 RepID=A0AAD6AFU3_9TELE|nr:hypothetical protein JOQ06_000249 [Pogonophryne albipinna]
MWRRLAQTLALLLCILGWGFVAFTLAMDRWRVAQVGGRGAPLWWGQPGSGLTCGRTAMKTPPLNTHPGSEGLFLGCIGTVLTFFGMECTLIGGDERSKDKMLITASSICSAAHQTWLLIVYTYTECWQLSCAVKQIHQNYEIGAPLYLGLVRCFLILSGSTVHCLTACRANHWKTKHPVVPPISVKGEDTCGRSIILRNASTYKMVSVVVV